MRRPSVLVSLLAVALVAWAGAAHAAGVALGSLVVLALALHVPWVAAEDGRGRDPA